MASTLAKVSHDCRPIGEEECMVLATPVKIEQVHSKVNWHPINVMQVAEFMFTLSLERRFCYETISNVFRN